MKINILIFTLLFTCKSLYGQEYETKYFKQVVTSDFEYLYESLQKTHYNLFTYKSKKLFDNHFESLKKKVSNDSLTYTQTVSLFQELVSYANTGHCEIDFPAQSYIKYAYAGGTVFPLELAFENGKAYIRKNFSGNEGLKVGDEIMSIDSKPISGILNLLYPYVSAERDYSKKGKIEFWSVPRLLYQVIGKQDKWLIVVKGQDKKSDSLTINSVSVIDYETKRNGELVNPLRKFKYIDNVAYLNPGAFGGAEPNSESQFKAFIDSVFADMKARKSHNLIIDLRNNPGGHNAYSDYLVSYFATKPFRWYSNFSLKSSKILKEHTRLQSDTTDHYSKAILAAKDGEVFKYQFQSCNPVASSKRFIGNIYVLTNRQTYSMAAVTAALIQDYKLGKIVGEETGDPPTLYASQFSYTLPKTGIVVKVPKGYIVRPNGDKKIAGVMPDINITDHLLDNEDEILLQLQNELKQGARK
jgi:hypothetical protein